jgi:hypothetical protein
MHLQRVPCPQPYTLSLQRPFTVSPGHAIPSARKVRKWLERTLPVGLYRIVKPGILIAIRVE